MHWLTARLLRYGLSKLTRYLIMETIKKFLKTKKGKAVIISLVLGVTGYNLPPEAVEALIVIATSLGY